MNKSEVLGILAIFIFVIAISGCNDTTTFEDQYFMFKVPSGVKVVDNSTDSKIQIDFYKGSDHAGTIFMVNMDNSIPMSYYGTETKIANKTAINDEEDLDAYIITDTVDNGNESAVCIGIDLPYTDLYDTIKNSIVIKKVPKTVNTE